MDERDPTTTTRLLDERKARVRAAKKHNEKVRLKASLYNALAVALIGAAFVFPIIRDENLLALLEARTWVWILAGIGLHWVALKQIDTMRPED